jgi:light-regulated signal transduction histidine kinase (bacteriophytochrome)
MKAPEKLKLTQNIWEESPATKLLFESDELAFQTIEKEKRAAELALVNQELKDAKADIVNLHEELEQKVFDRTAQLESANKELEAFSYSISHDLRSPLRAVLSFAKIIQKEYGDKTKPRIRELFNHIIIYIKRMNMLVDDLLRLAKHGKEKLKFAPLDMTHLVQSVWSNIQRIAPNHAMLELAELPIIQADASMMEQVIINLLSNAIKYSSKKEHPIVKVWCEQAKDNAMFYFKDNGDGFDMKHYDRLFKAFQRLHNTTDFEGTGVGLMLVKSIIEKHGGTVGADAKVGEGATFYFVLPLAK